MVVIVINARPRWLNSSRARPETLLVLGHVSVGIQSQPMTDPVRPLRRRPTLVMRWTVWFEPDPAQIPLRSTPVVSKGAALRSEAAPVPSWLSPVITVFAVGARVPPQLRPRVQGIPGLSSRSRGGAPRIRPTLKHVAELALSHRLWPWPTVRTDLRP